MKVQLPIPVDEINREAFNSKIEKGEGCWRWTGKTNGDGYGIYAHRNKEYKAHRVSWALKNGSIGDGLMACHKCDNPICVNPDHVFLGTNSVNVKDCWSKGRRRGSDSCFLSNNPRSRRGKAGAKVTDEMVRGIRKMLADGCSRKEIVSKWGISKGVVWWIHSGKRWAHVV